MIENVAQVTASYHTHALWYAEEEDWKRRQNNRMRFSSRYLSSRSAAQPIVPRYAFDEFARATVQALAHILSGAFRLKEAGDDILAANHNSALDSRSAVSSQPAAVTAHATAGASIRTYSLHVDQLAEIQVNQGNAFEKTNPTVITAGSNQMRITMAGESVPISVYLLHTDTNEQALQKLCGAFRYKELNINATLVEDEEQGTVRLQLTSGSAGAGQAFSIFDIYGNACSATGMDVITQPVQDAVYRVDDGTPITSHSNEVILDDGNVTVSFLDSSAERIELSVGPDGDKIRHYVQALVESYNGLRTALTDLSPLFKSGIVQAFTSPLSYVPLEELGLRPNADGTIELDDEALNERIYADFERLESGLRGPRGLGTALTKAVDRLLAQPSDQLLNPYQGIFPAFTNYHHQSGGAGPVRTYLPVPLAGNMLNSYL